MNENDRRLGMQRSITRRDLLHDGGVAALGAALLGTVNPALADAPAAAPSATDYPPVRTGMRGSHPGSFEAAHAIRDGAVFADALRDEETYDLVVVGGGISGLASAQYYRDRFGAASRILILENHDDFGGHARRNEFHQGGQMRLSLGGTHNLEHWQFSDRVWQMMGRLGVDIEALRANMEFDYGTTAERGLAIWFDQETYGEDRLVTPYTLAWWQPGTSVDCIDQFPLSDQAKNELKALYAIDENLFEDWDEDELEQHLWSISYPDFLKRYGGLSDEAVSIFNKTLHGAWGYELRALAAAEGFYGGLPGLNLLGRSADMQQRTYPVGMFPDGNASIARLQLAELIPEVAPGTSVDNVAVARFDYGKLDMPGAPVRLRLAATVANTMNVQDGVDVTYLHGGALRRVRAKHCVMACYHSILPYLCPDLPEEQKAAQRYQVKIPLLLINVLLRSSEALDKLGVDNVYAPGRMLSSLWMFKGINTGGYEHRLSDTGPVPYVFWGSISPPPDATGIHDQLRASRQKMLELTFADYEREVRTVLDGLLGPAGFKPPKISWRSP